MKGLEGKDAVKKEPIDGASIISALKYAGELETDVLLAKDEREELI